MHADRVRLHVLFVLAGLVAALWLYPWLAENRYQRLSSAPVTEFPVTSAADNGPGSLREALFRAIRADAPTVIVLKTRELSVSTPLPPLVTAHAIVVRSDGEPRTIHAAASLETPLFDVRTGRLELEDLVIRGAATYAIQTASANRVTLRRVTIADSNVGVRAAGAFELEVDDATFEDNRIGIEAVGSGTTLVTASVFRRHEEAALWAVGSIVDALDEGALQATGNRVEGGRFGIVLGNLSARVQDNQISGFRGDGILTIGGSLEITANRIWNGRGAAIRTIGMRKGLVEANDIHELGAMGILVQSATAATIHDNRLYRNGYGIVTVMNEDPASVELRNNLILAQVLDGLVVVGDSPLIVANRSLQNGAAGIRMFNLFMESSYRAAAPLMTDNVLQDNGSDEPVVTDYVLEGASE